MQSTLKAVRGWHWAIVGAAAGAGVGGAVLWALVLLFGP